MVSLSKTQPRASRVRIKENCAQSRGIVVVPVVVEPVVAPVPPVAVPIEVTGVQVAVRVAVAYEMPSVVTPSLRLLRD
jgi:hypothetical protein